jgi:hypothetical protein
MGPLPSAVYQAEKHSRDQGGKTVDFKIDFWKLAQNCQDFLTSSGDL